jgi:outer membrane protein OmpA-like peptidoglycan-associated protein
MPRRNDYIAYGTGVTIVTAIVFLIVLSLAATSIRAGDFRYLLAARGGMATLAGGDYGKFPLQPVWGIQAGYHPSERWTLSLDYMRYVLKNDTTASSSFTFDRDNSAATQKWKADRLGFIASRRLFDPDRRFNLFVGAGGGLMIWKVVDPELNTVLKVAGDLNQTIDFTSTEVFVSATTGIDIQMSRRLGLVWEVQADYLTAAGTEFASDVSSARDHWVLETGLKLSYSFGEATPVWPSYATSTETRASSAERLKELDSDGDGVPDTDDRCANTREGMRVDRNGCPLDSDGDGVPDGQDDCLNTDRRAAGLVDIHGCPVDSDFDGVADYLDQCPSNQYGAWVDASGCPTDSDADGVPDGLDDCPQTLVGVDVDRHGCIDLSMLAKPLILNIDYVSGSFEVDQRNKENLQRLARLLNFVKDIKLEISGYTDNIGTSVANRNLSLKRARRVNDYLVMLGIAADRIKTFGRGEDNFIASNNTAGGRAKNRRVEIIFYR